MIADKTYHLTKDGKAVSEDDPAGVSVLVAKGGFLSDADAKKYGITGGIEAADAKAAAAHAATEQEKKNVATIQDPRTKAMLESTQREAVVAGDNAKAVMVTPADKGEAESEEVPVTQEPATDEKQDVIAEEKPAPASDKPKSK